VAIDDHRWRDLVPARHEHLGPADERRALRGMRNRVVAIAGVAEGELRKQSSRGLRQLIELPLRPRRPASPKECNSGDDGQH
jgi:hypothetical protein